MSVTGPIAYPVLFLLVAAESSGVPLPGETSLIAAGVLASQGQLSLALVIVIAAAAAIVGDNVGYVLGRTGLRRLLARGEKRERLLQRGEEFFARHGGKAVLFGRFVTGVRVVIAWAAGTSDYPWPRFFAWNALGGICWAVTVASAAYGLGAAAKRDITLAGLLVLGLVLVAAAAYGGVWLWRRRASRRPASASG
jgi:membrane protein DedA with SNARE-associated domain